MGYPKEHADDNRGHVQLDNVLRVPKALRRVQENIIRKWTDVRPKRNPAQENAARIN